MTTRIVTFTQPSALRVLRLTVLSSFLAALPLFAAGNDAQQDGEHASSAKLVRLVREATRQFIDVNNATAAGYAPFLGCVSGSDHGAMACIT